MKFEITVLGNGSAMPTAHRHHSAHIINVHEQFYLIDCGEAVQIQIRRYGLPMLKINHLFITHLHGDHIFGIHGLLSTMNALERKTPLNIYAPQEMRDILEHHMKYYEKDFGFEIIFKEVKTNEHNMIYENKVLQVYTVPLRHSIATCGYLFKEKEPPLNVKKFQIERYNLSLSEIVKIKQGENIQRDGEIINNEELTYRPYKGRSYAFISDTAYSKKAAELISGVDILYHESTFLECDKITAKKTGHSTAQQAAKVAEIAKARKLLLGHFSARYKDELLFEEEAKKIFPNSEITSEGKTYSISLQ